MTGYDLSRQWFDFSFEKQECKVHHTALYMWIIELNNRLGWKETFGLPMGATMEGLSIGNKTTYSNTLKDLVSWGFIQVVQEAKNQYQSCIIKLCRYENEPALSTALSTALSRHSDQQRTGIESGTVTIDKPLNLETLKPLNLKTDDANRVDDFEETPFEEEKKETPSKVASKVSPKFDALKVALPHGNEFAKTWEDWVIHRREKKSPLTELSVKKQLELVSCYTEKVAIEIILSSITSGYQGLFPPKQNGYAKSNNNDQPGPNGISPRLESAWELLAKSRKERPT